MRAASLDTVFYLLVRCLSEEIVEKYYNILNVYFFCGIYLLEDMDRKLKVLTFYNSNLLFALLINIFGYLITKQYF